MDDGADLTAAGADLTAASADPAAAGAASLQEVQEGRVCVRLPRGVFYNPVQEFNRDMTVLLLRYFAELRHAEWQAKRAKTRAQQPADSPADGSEEYKGLRVLEALAASGLRSVRFAREVPRLDCVLANDVDPEAARLIAENAAANGVSHVVRACQEDALDVMMRHRRAADGRFDVIDLDPYGSAARFLDSAVQALSNGGLLCVTCTDAAVLTGAAAGTAFAKYGGSAYRGASSNEAGIRLLLHAVASAAARHGKVMEPLVALNIDFYFRVFVRLRDSVGGAKLAGTRVALVYHCVGCDTFHLQRLSELEAASGPGEAGRSARPAGGRGPPTVGPACPECGCAYRVSGPFWAQELHSRPALAELLALLQKDEAAGAEAQLATGARLRGMLSLAAEELPDVPLFWRLDRMSRTLRSATPRVADVRAALLHQGYRVSGSHVEPQALKTDAPPGVLWDIMTAWVNERAPVAPRSLEQSAALRRLLGRMPGVAPDFSFHPQAQPASRASGLLRFQKNPPNWGPKAKARRDLGENGCDSLEERRAALQGKRRRGKQQQERRAGAAENEVCVVDTPMELGSDAVSPLAEVPQKSESV